MVVMVEVESVMGVLMRSRVPVRVLLPLLPLAGGEGASGGGGEVR